MEFDYISYDKTKVESEAGVIEGGSTIVIIQSGKGGNIYGYDNKYLHMAKILNKSYGVTVMSWFDPQCWSNHFSDVMEFAKEYCKDKNFAEYEIFYFGMSNGGRQGILKAAEYPCIKKLMFVNAPFMIDFHKVKKGFENLKETGKEVWAIYGTNDPSYKYIDLLKQYESDNFHILTQDGADHNFINHLETFIDYPKLFF